MTQPAATPAPTPAPDPGRGTDPGAAPAPPGAPGAPGAEPVAPGAEPTAVRRRHRPRPPSPAGVVGGTLFAMLAMTPSLLPRDWLFQALVSGISAALGYGLGVALAWTLRHVPAWRRLMAAARHRVPPRVRTAVRPWLAPALAVAVVGGLLLALVNGARWQREMTAAIGMPGPSTGDWLRAGPLLVLVAAAFVLLARGLRWVGLRLERGLRRWLRFPRLLAGAVAVVLVAVLTVVLVNDVLLGRALSAADGAFALANTRDHPGVTQPEAAERSGSPESLVPWDTLGREGRRFVAEGPTADELAAASPDGSTTTPVRVYAGLDSADSAEGRAALAVDDLERAGAFDRAVLLVVTTTGSGWVNDAAVSALELMHGGDTATVATQYSYLPSWLSFLVDRSRAADEARALAAAVEARVAELPADDRPELLAYGESLGSFGSESAYDSLADIRARTDGVLWVGPPNSNPVWHALMERRDPGTTSAAPVYASGLLVRFAGDTAQMATPPTAWEDPRVLYLQHASDPIVWWGPDLLLSRPDWLAEPHTGEGGLTMTWYPLVTFWQLTFDLVNSKSVPDGHGHNYDALTLDGWVAVAAPDGWTDADTARVRAVLEQRAG
ncbi:alpha/beta-hydrolase family protein [Cellulomonas sp. PS-H5]|uniref:alpha/beta hydrolase n=1 Tax=Cellulomonas sp. PS-H5 TaxID=2820400 RepID=UPI001C4F41CB|nr:alpha/beta-hydrolase family protein [Cellulomonas sp. PS-H5]MBW0254300.1 alpha/beta-hydrolase family protein [Cellulomonas sp. PS-H5]